MRRCRPATTEKFVGQIDRQAATTSTKKTAAVMDLWQQRVSPSGVDGVRMTYDGHSLQAAGGVRPLSSRCGSSSSSKLSQRGWVALPLMSAATPMF